MTTQLNPIHPGEHLADFMSDFDVNLYNLANALEVPAGQIGQILEGKDNLSMELAIKLARFFGNRLQFWLMLQNSYALEKASENIDSKGGSTARPKMVA